MFLDVIHDRRYQVWHAPEDATFEALLIEVAEEALDDVEPRATRWAEMRMESRISLEPTLDLFVLVRGVVVDD